jgi:hypothetical protein
MRKLGSFQQQRQAAEPRRRRGPAARPISVLVVAGVAVALACLAASGSVGPSSAQASPSELTAKPKPKPKPPVNVARFGAVGNGERDDTAALQRAFRSGRTIYSDPGKTYLVKASLLLKGRADLHGSTIAFVGGSKAGYIGVMTSGRTALLANVTIDGRGRDGSWVRAVQVGQGHKLTAIAVRTRDTRGGEHGYGFAVDGTLDCTKCNAQGADYGFHIGPTATPETTISGSSSRNGIGMWNHGKAGGSVPRFVSVDDDRFGVLLDSGASHWKLGTIVTNYTGRTARNPSATGFEFWINNRHNVVDSLVSNGNPGYALAFNHNARFNRIRSVHADRTGAHDNDPGITFTDGSSNNRIDKAFVKDYSVGIRIGEDDPTPNNNNRILLAHIENCWWGGIRVEYGSSNRIDTVTLVNNSTNDSTHPGDITFANTSSGNSVGRVTQSGSSKRPTHGIYFGPATSRNRVEAGTVTSYSSSKVLDESGSNSAAVR